MKKLLYKSMSSSHGSDKNNAAPRKAGFTLAELLVVVAILAILVAVSIPIFSGKLEAAKLATDAANVRSAKAVLTNAILNGEIITNDGEIIEINKINVEEIFFYCEDGSLVKYSFGMKPPANACRSLTAEKEDAYNIIYDKGACLMVLITPENLDSFVVYWYPI